MSRREILFRAATLEHIRSTSSNQALGGRTDSLSNCIHTPVIVLNLWQLIGNHVLRVWLPPRMFVVIYLSTYRQPEVHGCCFDYRILLSLRHSVESVQSNVFDTMSNKMNLNDHVVQSNYECINQGTYMSRNLSYSPEFISRTQERQNKHKEQERERRKRLHEAIAELQRRLPSNVSSFWKKTLPVKQPQAGCKAATIEAAIAYIAHLEEQVDQLKRASSDGGHSVSDGGSLSGPEAI